MTIYVRQNENGTWHVYIEGRSIKEAASLNYQAAVAVAKNLKNNNGGNATIIGDEKGNQWIIE
ncbi:MAG: hypothetical protein IKQ13_10360 [Treponema sp.]|nr:hypothetical protein [Treponema sp.]MBR4247387.1 hypothetical protein [Treponema sp.]